MTSISGLSPGAGAWMQLQQQQAQRDVEQAQAKARVLQSQARQAQAAADAAQQNATSLATRADQASGEASNAALGLARANSLAATQEFLGSLEQQVKAVLAGPAIASTAAAGAVLNAEGQTTGTLVSVVA